MNQGSIRETSFRQEDPQPNGKIKRHGDTVSFYFGKEESRTCGFLYAYAGDRGRTGTVLPPRDFKSLASAYFATPAFTIDRPHHYSTIVITCQVQKFNFIRQLSSAGALSKARQSSTQAQARLFRNILQELQDC